MGRNGPVIAVVATASMLPLAERAARRATGATGNVLVLDLSAAPTDRADDHLPEEWRAAVLGAAVLVLTPGAAVDRFIASFDRTELTSIPVVIARPENDDDEPAGAPSD